MSTTDESAIGPRDGFIQEAQIRLAALILSFQAKRAAGFLLTRLPDLKLQRIPDPRRAAGKRWTLSVMLKTVLVDAMAGCQSFAEIENLTSNMRDRHVGAFDYTIEAQAVVPLMK